MAEEQEKKTQRRITISPNYSNRTSNKQNEGDNVGRIERTVLYRRRGVRKDLSEEIDAFSKFFRGIEGEQRKISSAFDNVVKTVQAENRKLATSFGNLSSTIYSKGRILTEGFSRLLRSIEGVTGRVDTFDSSIRRIKETTTSFVDTLNRQQLSRRIVSRFSLLHRVLQNVGRSFERSKEEVTSFFRQFSREAYETFVEGLLGPFDKVVYATERGILSILRFVRRRPPPVEEERIGEERIEDRRRIEVEREPIQERGILRIPESYYRRIPISLPSVLYIKDSDLVQESGAYVTSNQLNILVRKGIKVEGLEVDVRGGGMGLLDFLGLRNLFLTLRRSIFRFLPFIGIGAGIGMEVFARGSIREGILSWLFGPRQSSRLSNTLLGMVKGAITGLLFGPKGAIVGGIVGGIMGLFGRELRQAISSIADFFTSLQIQARRLFDYFVQRLEKFIESLTSVADKIVTVVSSIVSRVGEVVAVVRQRTGEVVRRGIEVGTAVGQRTGEVVRRGIEAVGRGREWIQRLLSEKIGWVSQLFESGRGRFGPFFLDETLLTKIGVTGAGTYVGPWQMTEETFRRFARRYGYDRELQRYRFATPEWQRKWTEIVRREGAQRVGEQMREYIAETHYLPLIQQMGVRGAILAGRGRAIQEMLYAIAVQYGSRIGAEMVMGALKGIDEERLQRMTDEEIVSTIMQYKRATLRRYFTKEPQRIIESMYRADIEKERLLLQIAREEEKARTSISTARPSRSPVFLHDYRTSTFGALPGQVSSSRFLSEIESVSRRLVAERAEVDRTRIVSELRPLLEGVVSQKQEQRVLVGHPGYGYDVDKIPIVVEDVGAILLLMGAM